MAKMQITGLDEVTEQMKNMGQLSGRVADEMLMAGSAEMVPAWKNAIQRYGHVKTGTMLNSVKPTKIKNRPAGKELYVYPQGYDRNNRKKPTRNAEKAFVLHYGRRNMDASHFVDAAEIEGEPKATKAMVKRWDEFIEKGS